MKTYRQRLFDNFFFGFNDRWMALFIKLRTIREYALRNMGPEFNNAWRKTIRPYWAKYGLFPGKYHFKYLYELTGNTNPRNIPQSIFMEYIIPYFDEQMFIRQLADKNLHTLMFPSIKRPETIFKHIKNSYLEDDFLPIPKAKAYARLRQEGNYIIKPTCDSGEGSDVQFFTGFSSDAEIDAFLAHYEGKTDYIVQRAVVQHPDIARFNPTSLNTMRIVTMVFHDKTYILSSILRIGGSGSRVDNVAKGGYQCTIRPDGRLEPLAWTNRSGHGELVETTEDGLRFGDCAIPHFDKVRATAIDMATRMPHLKLIGWDLAVDEAGDVVLIEFNSQIGQNQATCGPTFGDMTEEILAEVFQKHRRQS